MLFSDLGAVCGRHIDGGDDVRFREALRGLVVATVVGHGLFECLRRKVRSEAVRQSHLRGQVGAKQ